MACARRLLAYVNGPARSRLLRRDDIASAYVRHLIERIVVHHDGRIVRTPKTGGRNETEA